MPERVVVVDPYSSGSAFAGALRKGGFEPVGVLSYPPPPPRYAGSLRTGDYPRFLTATEDPDSLLGELAALSPIAVVPGAESGVLLADRLAANLTPHRANDQRRSSARRHKGAMVAALAEQGIRTIRTLCTSTPADAQVWRLEQGLADRDLVVKPAMSGATDGVRLVRAGQDPAAAVAELLDVEVNIFGLPNTDVVVQERIFGTEYVVDTFSRDGRHTVTNVCRYHKVDNGHNFAVYESIEFLPPDAPENAALIPYVESVLDALGIRFGLAHSEVMMTTDGPTLIETGARLAGAGLPGLCELATGENGVGRLIDDLAGRAPGRTGYQLVWHVSSVFLIMREHGTVANAAAYEKIRALPSCRLLQLNVHDGDLVTPTSDLMSTMHTGWAVLAHRDAAQIRRDHEALRAIEQEVRLVRTNGPG
ncbi:ATP-grasp domain-containing protein [Actinoplanes sp. NPDC049599]|uniref:ATP-grasp domain-containing protein n=1 Tax=Actinoplanes sp. NPDC049599 TaxID=3363903 RepID=UPI0037A5CA8E